SMYLNVSKAKMESKGVRSVASRVVNLKDLKPDLTIDIMKRAMYNGFIEEYGHIDRILNYNEIASREEVRTLYAKYSSREWLLGKSPDFDFEIENRFAWGGIEIGLNVRKGMIREAVVYSDSMDLDFIESLRASLKDIEFSRKSLARALASLPENEERADLLEWFDQVEL
ncbi:MAG TPA: lipoate protein ligase C-terminal domain-containing protein, partial [Mesotoga infera]|nr:lipoate protein ligase C-terminal domain-containing protein [Mesotoga infera]